MNPLHLVESVAWRSAALASVFSRADDQAPSFHHASGVVTVSIKSVASLWSAASSVEAEALKDGFAWWEARLEELYKNPAQVESKDGRPLRVFGYRWVLLGTVDFYPTNSPVIDVIARCRSVSDRRKLIAMVLAVRPVVGWIREAFEINHWDPLSDTNDLVGYLFKDENYGRCWLCVPESSPIQEKER